MSKKTYFFYWLYLISLVGNLKAQSAFYPEPLLKLNSTISHHALVVEKSTHKLYLYEEKNSLPHLVKEFKIVTGKKSGNKLFQGDYRTPEGIYHFTDFLTHDQLIKRHGKSGEIYGVGAFVMDYPNPYDLLKGKTGSGIWLHSTNDETRIEKGLDSRGCVVATNKDLISISEYIELNRTPIVVVQDLKFLSKEAWVNKRRELTTTLKGWLEAWRSEDIKSYTSYYHKEDFRDKRRVNWNGLYRYKKAVFSNPGTPKIELTNVSIMVAGDLAQINFIQEYESQTIDDTGKKTLYLTRDAYYKWKIISENWTKRGIVQPGSTKVAFRPSMRFFKTKIPDQIVNFPIKGQN